MESIRLKTGDEWIPEIKEYIKARLPERNLNNHTAYLIATDPTSKGVAALSQWLEGKQKSFSEMSIADRVNGSIRLRGSLLDLHPLCIAALYGRVDLLTVLCRTPGVIPPSELRDHWNNTPLHYAALGCHRRAVQYLMEQGCEVRIENILKGTAMQYLKYVGPKTLTEVHDYHLIEGDVHMEALMMFKWYLHVPPKIKSSPENERFLASYLKRREYPLRIEIGQPDDEGNPLPREMGRRLFSTGLIPSDIHFVRYGGVSFFRGLERDPAWEVPDCFSRDTPGKKGIYLAGAMDAASFGSEASFAVHGTPNAELSYGGPVDGWPEVSSMSSIREILPGEEIAIHYALHTINYATYFREPRMGALKTFLREPIEVRPTREWFFIAQHLIQTVPLMLHIMNETDLISIDRLKSYLAILKRITRSTLPHYEWIASLDHFLMAISDPERLKQGLKLLHSAFLQLDPLHNDPFFNFYRAISSILKEIETALAS